MSGFNSFLAPYARHEYQIDVSCSNIVVPIMIRNKQKFGVGMKFVVVTRMKNKLQDDVSAGVIEGKSKMGEKLELIYSDEEGNLRSNVNKEYIENQKNRNTQNPDISGVRGEVHPHV